MDKIKKLFQKITKSDRKNLLSLIERLITGDSSLAVIKVKSTDFYRLRYKNFRIIFHRDNDEVVIDSVRMRNENTYKNL